MLKHLRRLRPPRPAKTLSSLDAYSRWAASYPPRAHNALMKAEEAAMLSLLPALEGQTVLDLACGTGRYGRLALERGAARVIGLDNSAAMLRATRGLSPLLSPTYWAEATCEAIPLAGAAVDVILCGLALGHLPRLTPSLREMGRVLRPGGAALVSDFHPFLALNGGQRTFTAPDGATYAVEHYPHLYADVHQAAGEAGLRIEHVVEPRLDNHVPVAIVYRFRKT